VPADDRQDEEDRDGGVVVGEAAVDAQFGDAEDVPAAAGCSRA
jgi:hypothetical protein